MPNRQRITDNVYTNFVFTKISGRSHNEVCRENKHAVLDVANGVSDLDDHIRILQIFRENKLSVPGLENVL